MDIWLAHFYLLAVQCYTPLYATRCALFSACTITTRSSYSSSMASTCRRAGPLGSGHTCCFTRETPELYTIRQHRMLPYFCAPTALRIAASALSSFSIVLSFLQISVSQLKQSGQRVPPYQCREEECFPNKTVSPLFRVFQP